MRQPEALTRDAVALANVEAGEVVAGLMRSAPEAEAARQMQICNACRYCEGFKASVAVASIVSQPSWSRLHRCTVLPSAEGWP